MLKINKSELEAVAVRPAQYPPDGPAEIAFAGRSNVGKSSLLNLLTGRKNLARVSGAPGKTRTINFYRINDRFRIVDLPGYGYAKVSKSVTEDWGQMMERYLGTREGLRCVIQLVDIRHAPTRQDLQMYEYLRHYGLDGIVVATKADKVSRNEQAKNLAGIRKELKLGPEDILLPVSALKRTGTEQLLDVIEKVLEE
ncbi:ribosome biogenesis GTP-binding protein YihA/YsxC [Hornefia butyriciproducens]|jgi:GTP-binding protein|uniref:ribosome biogenesis GTP-binding protein YihA/YsxC n=1 Tax=Hornefia butyriciproducens TaxID=2652293 RepID=UPI0029FC959C|nr:ribosome biogenesis GTP-binding protein YihA/YsxC [Hornefia butyriciproducens]MCI7678606.1 ribosome biogenesis GTP-binding protein YihA/YsxC [Clostridiales bacterium]MDD7020843.1 ribosome biogenesis GTP-binding protein YihA/YsxC [Hornefia butyriciproducens]MDY5422860.1 ribosome biogenesis GTP-binding protein YihA/YsxC [Hornefia butyriciproducens]MDY5462508.1 ribosome biogenesis GTP-binding protein YihA/YsxC [Hornefia butyriciproducens]